MKDLITFLLKNLQIDFSGEVTLDAVRQFLREDDSREARKLLGKLIEDQGVDGMVITMCDCLKEHVPIGITDRTVAEQLRMYADS